MPTRSLEGDWQFRCPHPLRGEAPRGLRLNRWMPATMPGTVHYQLQKLGKIPDPYHDRNELLVQWVDGQDWELRRTVRVSVDDCTRTRQELVFDGIDTIATITLNGHEVGRSINMFRQLVCDVRGKLHPGDNEVRVLIESPTRYTEATAKRHRHPSKRADFEWQTGERRMHHREWIRKTQCHFGWDWGVYLATSGVWQPARLECEDAPRIASVNVAQQHHVRPGSATRERTVSAVDLRITVELQGNVPLRGVLTVTCGGESASVRVSRKTGAARVTATLTLRDPELWWPAGEGEPALYGLETRFDGDGGASVKSRCMVGMRTLELVTNRESEGAESFYFRVNGRAIYARGSNWIPVDQLVDRAQPQVYRHLLESAVAAHMNMIRVWGGGCYEQDVFYELCDELGLLVWQDFMMACELYPDTPEFIAELSCEARYQVQRLQHHACLALWCGDNEDAEAVTSWWGSQPDHRQTSAIYRRTMSALKKVCEHEDPTRRFWLSSPSNGGFDGEPNDPRRGDVHYWKVWHGRRPFSDYRTVKPRFVSEFGFQSFPEPRTIRSVVPSDQINPSSRAMEHHQRSPEGNLLITNTMAREVPIPKDFDSFCYMSQINQAMAIRTAVEHWRRLKPWCMGTLFWQLNDLWPVASWSAIDYHGRWKVLQHMASRFYAPLLASIVVEGDELEVWITSDVPQPLALSGALEIVTWTGRRIARVALTVQLKALESRRVLVSSGSKLLSGRALPHEVCAFVQLAGDGQRAENFANLVPWKWVTLRKPKLTLAARERAQRVELTVRTDVITPFFHAELAGEEGHFVGDWQVLRPGRTYVMPWRAHVRAPEATAITPSGKTRKGRALPAVTALSFYDLYEH